MLFWGVDVLKTFFINLLDIKQVVVTKMKQFHAFCVEIYADGYRMGSIQTSFVV